jgi:3'-phosphoadenosine 5'-phosphosulfate (PAPS) 3'-phosphatase
LNTKTFEPHIAATLNRFSAVEKAIELLKPNVTMRIGGSGNKCLYILDNKADYLIHTVKSMKYWDVCANEALVRGRFGVVTDKDKKPIIYETSEKNNFTLPNGLIIARNQSIYDLSYERVKDYLTHLKVERGRPI